MGQVVKQKKWNVHCDCSGVYYMYVQCSVFATYDVFMFVCVCLHACVFCEYVYTHEFMCVFVHACV